MDSHCSFAERADCFRCDHGPDTCVFTGGPAACGGLRGVQVWLQACSSLPDGRPHVRSAGPGLDAPGAVSGQPSAGSPQERATFLHLAVSQTQNHFLSKSHDSPQRADQQAYAASFVLAETGGPSSPTLSKERPKTQENTAGIKAQILFHEHRDGASAAGQALGQRLGLRRERVRPLRTPTNVLPQVQC